MQEKQNTYDTIQAKVTEKQAALDSASVALEEKQEQLESNTSTAEDAKKAAERAVEDAGLSADIDHTQEINAISLEQFQKQLEKLKILNPKAAERRDNCTILRDYYKSMCGNRAENNRHGGSCHER